MHRPVHHRLALEPLMVPRSGLKFRQRCSFFLTIKTASSCGIVRVGIALFLFTPVLFTFFTEESANDTTGYAARFDDSAPQPLDRMPLLQ